MKNLYCLYYYDIELNKCKIKRGTPLRLWENNGSINSVDPYGCFMAGLF